MIEIITGTSIAWSRTVRFRIARLDRPGTIFSRKSNHTVRSGPTRQPTPVRLMALLHHGQRDDLAVR